MSELRWLSEGEEEKSEERGAFEDVELGRRRDENA